MKSFIFYIYIYIYYEKKNINNKKRNNIHIAGVNGPIITLQTSFLPRAINAAVIL